MTSRPSLILPLLLLSLLASTVNSHAYIRSHQPEVDASVANCKKWLALIDGGYYRTSYKEASQDRFQPNTTEEKWVQKLKSMRLPLGKLISRAYVKKSYTRFLPDGTEGEFVVITTEGSYDNMPRTRETILYTEDSDGEWRPASYEIKAQ